jgi:hypothetical protein
MDKMILNVKIPAPLKVKDEGLRQTDNFTYLSSIIISEGDTKGDIHSKLGKARRIFREMNNIFREINNIWRSSQYSTKLKLYQSCVVSTFLFGSEYFRITETGLSKLRSFYTTCLR